MDDQLAPGVTAPADALRIQFSRSSGPGGQNVNKLNTKAELWLAIDRVVGMSPAAMGRLIRLAGRRITMERELHLVCESERSAAANERMVLDRLRQMMIEASIEPRRRRKTRPSRASKQRRIETKKRRSDVKSNRRSVED
jgi:ribosome-associated protein